MKKEFWIKKDRTKDGPDNWEKMSSYEFARFMETADGKSRKENIARVPGGESGEPIIYMEVDSQTAKEWKRENNRACYLQKTMNALGIEVISYNVSPNTEDWEVNAPSDKSPALPLRNGCRYCGQYPHSLPRHADEVLFDSDTTAACPQFP